MHKEVQMWGSFTCPNCHKLLRVRRNYPIRVLRLVLVTAVVFYLLAKISGWVSQHAHISIFVAAGTIGLIDEYLMRLLPAKIESAAPGGFTAS